VKSKEMSEQCTDCRALITKTPPPYLRSYEIAELLERYKSSCVPCKHRITAKQHTTRLREFISGLSGEGWKIKDKELKNWTLKNMPIILLREAVETERKAMRSEINGEEYSQSRAWATTCYDCLLQRMREYGLEQDREVKMDDQGLPEAPVHELGPCEKCYANIHIAPSEDIPTVSFLSALTAARKWNIHIRDQLKAEKTTCWLRLVMLDLRVRLNMWKEEKQLTQAKQDVPYLLSLCKVLDSGVTHNHSQEYELYDLKGQLPSIKQVDLTRWQRQMHAEPFMHISHVCLELTTSPYSCGDVTCSAVLQQINNQSCSTIPVTAWVALNTYKLVIKR